MLMTQASDNLEWTGPEWRALKRTKRSIRRRYNAALEAYRADPTVNGPDWCTTRRPHLAAMHALQVECRDSNGHGWVVEPRMTPFPTHAVRGFVSRCRWCDYSGFPGHDECRPEPFE